MNTTSFVKFDLANDKHVSFYKELFSEEYKARLLSWQYSGGSTETDCLLFTENNKLIGFNGITKLRALYKGDEVDVFWSGDFIVKKEYRGKGYGKSLKMLLKEKYHDDIVMSLGISNNAFNILTSLGWQTNNEKTSKVDTYQYISAQQRVTLRGAGIAFLQGYWKAKLRKRVAQYVIDDYKFIHSFTLPFKNVVDSLWASVKTTYTSIVVRDFEYLNKRYVHNPLGSHAYSYLSIYEHDELVGLMIYRKDAYNLTVVDYIGARQSLSVKANLINYITINNPLHVLNFTTNDEGFKHVLKCFGYLKKNAERKFLVREGASLEAVSNWFLMAGDSDGELLTAAKLVSKSNYNFSIYNMDEFLALRESWTELLLNSSANPLFMSWEWVFSWWSTWGSQLNLTLHLIVIFEGKELVGIAPLYSENIRRFLPWLGSSAQFIGNHWEKTATVRSEYISPIICNKDSVAITEYLVDVIKNNQSIVTIAIPDSCISIKNHQMNLMKRLKDTQLFTRVLRSKNYGYKLFTGAPITEYTKSLGRSTRASYFNKLDKAKSIGLIYKESELPHPNFITVLNAFHELRWGKEVFDKKAFRFQLTLSALLESSAHLHFFNSVIMHDNEVVSCSYNLVANNVVYNIQSGFREDFGQAISLGKLNFGFLIKDCFVNQDIHGLDFLIGNGKHTNYKKNLKTKEITFVSVSIYRKSFVGYSIKLHLLFSIYIKKVMKKLVQL